MIKKVVKENYKYIIVLFLTIVLFYVLRITNEFRLFKTLDQNVADFIKNNFSSNLEKIFNFTSDLIGIYTLIIIIVCILLKFKNKLYIKLTLVTYTFTLLITSISKIIISRPRPLIEVTATIDKYSFPSGHTLVSFVMYYFMAYILTINSDKYTKIAYYIISTILVFTVAFSRLYLGVHYFTDVIGAIIFGIVILLMIINIIKKNFKEKLV